MQSAEAQGREYQPQRELWPGPLRFLPQAGTYIADAFVQMARGGSWGFAVSRIFRGLGGAMLAAALIFLTTILGRRICNWIRLPVTRLNRPERFAVELAVGVAAFGLVFFCIGLVRAYRGWVVLGVLVAIAGGCRREFVEVGFRFRELFRGLGNLFRDRIGLPFAVLAAVSVVVALPVTLAPAFSVDALVYHLAVPKAYLAHGGILELPWNIYAYFPMNTEMFFLAAMSLGGEIAAKFVHLAFGLAAAAGIYGYARRFVSQGPATAAMAAFVTAPSVAWLLGFAYIDLVVALLIVAAVIAFTAYADGKKPERPGENKAWPLVLGIILGALIGTKYSGIPVAALFGFMMLVLIWRRGGGAGNALKRVGIFALVAFLVGSPWLARNAVWTGNPIFPFAGVNKPYWDEEQQRELVQFVKNYGYGDSKLERYALLPWNISINSAFMYYPADNYDGIIGPLLLILLPLMFGVRKGRNLGLAALLMLGGFLLFVFTTQQMRFFLPWLGPLIVLGIACAERAGPKFTIVALAAVCAVAITNTFISIVHVHRTGPLHYVLGVEDRGEFLDRQLMGEHRFYREVNKLEPATLTLLVNCGNFGYWCDRPFIHDSFIGTRTLWRAADRQKTSEGIRNELRKMGVTHIGMEMRYFQVDMQRKKELKLVPDFLNKYTRPIFYFEFHKGQPDERVYVLYQLTD
ncbi:MAG: hypothetical protein E3J72_13565 [Planctomycetota bacterium]|nr:MAG: hypothetical protein E3J72_13565 [Planctomycetota bacterium]